MPAWFLFVLLSLSVYRLSRLIIEDQLPLVKIPRDALVEWLDPAMPEVPEGLTSQQGAEILRHAKQPPWGAFGTSLAYLVECQWCTPVWASALVVWLTTMLTSLPLPVLWWAGAASVASWLLLKEPEASER